MLSASTSLPLPLQLLAWVFTVVVLFAAIYGAIYLVRSGKVKTNNELADSAVASLQAANQALASRMDVMELDNKHCHELRVKQDVVIDQQTKRIDQLTEDVTQRAAVAEFRDEVRGLLLPMAEKLGVKPDEHPPVAVGG
jgi:hypothetical protein